MIVICFSSPLAYYIGQASLPVLPRGSASPGSTLLQIGDVPAREGKQFRVRGMAQRNLTELRRM